MGLGSTYGRLRLGLGSCHCLARTSHCLALPGIAWHCMATLGIAWHCLALLSQDKALLGIAWHCLARTRHCLARSRLLGQWERQGERSRERAREAGPPRREESWAPGEGYWRGCGGAAGTVRRGSGYWRSCRSRSALVRSVCTVGSNFGGDLDVSETGL